MPADIKTREDVFLLVSGFYKKVRKDPEIGHFFNEVIRDWDTHIEKLTDFWESNLFFKALYKGNPQKVHVRVDQENNQEISSYHFGIWLNLWFATIDELFEGELANRAKNNARKMSSHLYLKIFQAREK